MKKIKKTTQLIAMISVFILLFTNMAFASPPNNSVGEEDAVNLALFYYRLNLPEDEQIEISSYIVTPLYNENGEITYYCVDFFNNDEPKGYVVIGADVTYLQCPEMSYEDASQYYYNSLVDRENIYFNPMETFTADEHMIVFYDENNIVDETDVEGTVLSGDAQDNRSLLTAVASGDPTDSVYPFSEHPSVLLAEDGFSNIYTQSYDTIESDLTATQSFNLRSIPGYATSWGPITNPNYSTIHVMANILRYWEDHSAPNYGDTYSQILSDLIGFTQTNYYGFSKDGTTDLPVEYIDDVFLGFNRSFSYNNGRVLTNTTASFSFIQERMAHSWPILLYFNGYSSNGTFDPSMMLFAYNIVNGYLQGNLCSYRFVKVHNGKNNQKYYICWDAISNYKIMNSSAVVNMYAFCPY